MCNPVYIKKESGSTEEIEFLTDLKKYLDPVLLGYYNSDCLNKENTCCCCVDWAATAKKNNIRIIDGCDGIFIGHEFCEEHLKDFEDRNGIKPFYFDYPPV